MEGSFSKKYHLRSKRDFSYLRVKPKVLSDSGVRFYFKKARVSDCSRLGVSIARKVGKATARNKLRRVIRESFRQCDFKHLGYDVLIVVSNRLLNKISLEEGKDQIREQVSRFFASQAVKLGPN